MSLIPIPRQTDIRERRIFQRLASALGAAADVAFGSLTLSGLLTTAGGRVVGTTVKTDTYTLTAEDFEVDCDTDLRAWTLTFPAGIDGTKYRVHNVGSKDLTLSPDGTEDLLGENEDFIVFPGGSEELTFNATHGWW